MVGFCFCQVGWVDRSEPVRAHDQYADEQLANLQKRICLIEFLRLDLIIVYQGRPTPTKNTNHPNGWFILSIDCSLP